MPDPIQVRVIGRHVLASYDPSVHGAAEVHAALRVAGAEATELGQKNSLILQPGWHLELVDNRPAVRARNLENIARQLAANEPLRSACDTFGPGHYRECMLCTAVKTGDTEPVDHAEYCAFGIARELVRGQA